MEGTTTRRVVLLGKTGAGKSSLANTIFGENVFTINHPLKSETRKCQAETRSVNGRSITLIDTPGSFDTDRPEEELKTEIVRFITECAPHPRAFLIVVNVEKFTKREKKDVIRKIREYFSEEAFKYAAVVFTHGHQLPEGKKIEEFVSKKKRDLVKKCGGRCHVVDNKYWNENQPDEYKSNQFQVAELLNTIDKIHHIRIVLLGKTGAGKSSAANTIFGENVFEINNDPNSGTSKCEEKSRSVNGKSITLIDTPGFFDPDKSKKKLRDELVTCITECAPGPHAFLILLKVEKFTEHEKQIIDEIQKSFSEEAFKYSAVVFTHGDQLLEGTKIEEFFQKSEGLIDVVKKCGGRCHVIDSKYWKKKQEDEYRSNEFQVAELLNTIDNMVNENNGGFYTNEMLQTVDRLNKKHGKIHVPNLFKAAGIASVLWGALLGVRAKIIEVVRALKKMRSNQQQSEEEESLLTDE